jgi:hypothetical protein
MVSTVAAAGCSSNDPDPQNPPAATPDATPNKGTTPQQQNEAGPGDDTGPCLADNPIDAAQFPYSKAVKAPGACTTKDLEELATFFKAKAGAEDIKMSDWAKVVSAGCAKCVFTDTAEAEWGPILTKDDKLEDVNRGGCIEIVSGKPACGEAYQQVASCRIEACVQNCKTQQEFGECLQDAQAIFSGPCQGAFDTLSKECGDNLGAYEQACKGATWTFEGPVKVQCITGGAGGDGG